MNKLTGTYRIENDTCGLRAVVVTATCSLSLNDRREFNHNGFMPVSDFEYRKLLIPSSSRRDSLTYAVELLSRLGITPSSTMAEVAKDSARMADEECARYSRFVSNPAAY
jgi:hypothetical protein